MQHPPKQDVSIMSSGWSPPQVSFLPSLDYSSVAFKNTNEIPPLPHALDLCILPRSPVKALAWVYPSGWLILLPWSSSPVWSVLPPYPRICEYNNSLISYASPKCHFQSQFGMIPKDPTRELTPPFITYLPLTSRILSSSKSLLNVRLDPFCIQ